MNPRRDGSRLAFRFRSARRHGYGAAPEMVARCLTRCDDDGIRGTVRVLRTLSDTHPVYTQGPVWQLDGSRGFNALSRVQRWLVVALVVIAWLFVRDGIIALVGIVAAWRAWQKNGPAAPDWNAFAVYVFLLAGLTALVPFTAHH